MKLLGFYSLLSRNDFSSNFTDISDTEKLATSEDCHFSHYVHSKLTVYTKMRFLSLSLCSLLFFALTMRGQTIIDGFSSSANDRYANNPSFVADAFDLSGVTLSGGGRWATLISNNVVISAQHFNPGLSSLTFYETNDPAGNSVVRQIDSVTRIGSSDIWLGVLDEPVGSSITPFSFATETVTTAAEFIAGPYAFENAYLFGRSPTSFTTSLDMAVGRNVLDGYITDFAAASANGDAVLATRDDPLDPNYVAFEAFLQPGDSGGPLFADIDGKLVLVGVNWFIIDRLTSSDLSGVTYVGNYAAEIQAFIDENSIIPEPAATAFVMGIFVGAMLIIRRNRRRVA